MSDNAQQEPRFVDFQSVILSGTVRASLPFRRSEATARSLAVPIPEGASPRLIYWRCSATGPARPLRL